MAHIQETIEVDSGSRQACRHDAHPHVDWEAELEPERPGQEAELAEAFTQASREGLESLRQRLES